MRIVKILLFVFISTVAVGSGLSLRNKISNNETIIENNVNTSNIESNQITENTVQEDVENTTPSISVDDINITLNEYGLELPINGATGYTTISMSLYSDKECQTPILTLNPGTAFIIEKEFR